MHRPDADDGVLKQEHQKEVRNRTVDYSIFLASRPDASVKAPSGPDTSKPVWYRSINNLII